MKLRELFLAAFLFFACSQPSFAHHDLDDNNHTHAKKASLSVDASGDPFHLLDFLMSPAYALTTNVRTYIEGPYRIIDSNGIPNHPTGQFPGRGNPNAISEQEYKWRMVLDPKFSGGLRTLNLEPFGVAINGVPFDPGANEFWNRDRSSGWQYEPMFNHSLGLDQNNAHVQPNGAYHYHGLPTGLIERLAQSPKPVLIGYAADGFPIYAPFGYRDAKDSRSTMTKLRSSYRLKSGNRPSGPGGAYDGTFVADYEYVAGAGDLDESNGRFGVTSEYPKGIYQYYVTDAFPYIPRIWKGTPDETFLRHGHVGGAGGGYRRPGGGPDGPRGQQPGNGQGAGVGGPRDGQGGMPNWPPRRRPGMGADLPDGRRPPPPDMRGRGFAPRDDQGRDGMPPGGGPDGRNQIPPAGGPGGREQMPPGDGPPPN